MTWHKEDNKIVSDGESYVEFLPIKSYYSFNSVLFSANQSLPEEVVKDIKFEKSDNNWSGIDSSNVSWVEKQSGNKILISGTPYSARSGYMPIRDLGIAQAKINLYPITPSTVTIDVLDAADNNIIRRHTSKLISRKWQEQVFEFEIKPSSGWITSDDGTNYNYRRMIEFEPVDVELTTKTTIMLSDIDFDLLCEREDNNDVRLMFFDGMTSRQVPFDYTGAGELWFRLEQNLPTGITPTGSFVGEEFYGAYYLYYGNANELEAPLNNELMALNDIDINRNYEIELPIPSPVGEGSIVFEYLPNVDLMTLDIDEKHTILDTDFGLSIFFGPKRLFVMHNHRSGFRSGAIFDISTLIFEGVSKKFAINWTKQYGKDGITEARDYEAWSQNDSTIIPLPLVDKYYEDIDETYTYSKDENTSSGSF